MKNPAPMPRFPMTHRLSITVEANSLDTLGFESKRILKEIIRAKLDADELNMVSGRVYAPGSEESSVKVELTALSPPTHLL